MPLVEIGKLFLSKYNAYLSHCSDLQSKNKIADLLEFDKEIDKWVNDLKHDAKLISKLSALDVFKYKEKSEIMDILSDYNLTELLELKLKLKQK
jgi:hypothetical protein